MRIKGVAKYTDLLGEAGSRHRAGLAAQSANLLQKMVEVNEKKKLVRRLLARRRWRTDSPGQGARKIGNANTG
jgi:hypothetical protein